MSEAKEQRKLQCVQCNKTFRCRRHIEKHMEGHKINDCVLCDTFLSTRKEHILHMATEHDTIVKSEKYSCEHCDKRFVKRLQLYYHYKREHAGTLEVCFKCGLFLNPGDVKLHQEKHEAERVWKCKICIPSESFSRKQQYLIHIKGHEKHRCDVCNLSFSTKVKTLRHNYKFHQSWLEDKLYACPICGMRFPRPGLLSQHNRTHTGEKPFFCKDCNKHFISQKGYKKHLKFTHEGKRRDMLDVDGRKSNKFKCDMCGKSFNKESSLVKHMERPHSYQCEFCSYVSSCKENAKRHLALHTEDRQFVCEQCGTAFFTLSNLQDHNQYVHSNERLFQCHQCTSAFKTNSALNRHLQTHSDLRPYGCHCGQTYKRISHLHRHQQSTHGPTESKRLQRLQRDESGALVPVIEVKKTKTRNKLKMDRKPQPELADNIPTEPPVLSLFVADSGHMFTLQQSCQSDLSEATALQNVEVDSYRTELLQTMQVAYDEHLTPDVTNTDSQLVFGSGDSVDPYPHMQLQGSVEPSLLVESFFASHEPTAVAHYQTNEMNLTSDQSFFNTQHGASNFGGVEI